MRAVLWLPWVGATLLSLGCEATNPEEDNKKAGICIHSLIVTPKANDCTACTAGSPTCDAKAYTYCSDEKKADDCLDHSATCSTAMSTKADYSDTTTFYDGGKKCDTNGYTIPCANPKYKAASAEYCPP